jgi:hypothetical protein
VVLDDRPRTPAPAQREGAIVALDVLGGRQQDGATTEAREALVLVGTERLRLRLSTLAAELGQSAETASRWISRGARRRLDDPAFADTIARLARSADLAAVAPNE